jgi:hypothetical protein
MERADILKPSSSSTHLCQDVGVAFFRAFMFRLCVCEDADLFPAILLDVQLRQVCEDVVLRSFIG